MLPSESFEKNGWVKIIGFIDRHMAKLFYRHVQYEAQRCKWFEKNGIEVDLFQHGTFDDKSSSVNVGTFAKYGDPIFDTLLDLNKERISKIVGKKLFPQYTYHRLYIKGVPLIKHRDRPGSGIAISMCLGYDVSNVKKNYNWPLYISGIPLHMNPGDVVIYRGELEHWRENFLGIDQAQLFLFYSEKSDSYDFKFDGRPILGMPGNFKSEESINHHVQDYLKTQKIDINE